jgi:hypothetical protein
MLRVGLARLRLWGEALRCVVALLGVSFGGGVALSPLLHHHHLLWVRLVVALFSLLTQSPSWLTHRRSRKFRRPFVIGRRCPSWQVGTLTGQMRCAVVLA